MKRQNKRRQIKFEDLKIGFDAKRAVCNLTGIGNYSRCLIDSLSLLYPKNQYILYSPKNKDNPRLDPLLQRNNVKLITPSGLWAKLGSLWRSLEVTRTLIDDEVSLYHGLSNELPLNIARSGIPSVVTIHDLIWRKIPDNYSAIDRKLYDLKYKASAEAATRIIAISECTKRDIVNDFGIAPDKIDVVYQCCDPLFAAPRDARIAAEVKAKYQLPERYILAVGTVEVRKNQLQAVKALRGLDPDIKLVIVGRRHKSYGTEIDRYLASNRIGDRVIWLTDVPNEHLPYLYAMACFATYTSRYEGFGLPIIESLTTGTPVIAATGSCLEEAGGKGAIYVDPDDIDQYIDAAKTLIDSSYYYHKYADSGAAHIKKFNLAEFARQTMNTYTRAIVDIY